MVEDANGVLWIATPSHGVIRVRRQPGHEDWQSAEWKRYDTDQGLPEGHDWIIRFQNVDGFPSGHASHWTLPFDAWCVTLAKLTSLRTAGLLAS